MTNPRTTTERYIKEYLREHVETALPGIVIDIGTYEETQQIAVVQPLINLVFDDNQVVEMPYLFNVPVELTGTQESLISVPIKVGDTVTLKFCKRSLDELKEQATAATYNPRDRRWFDTNDAIAFPTTLIKSSTLHPHSEHVEIKFKDILVSYQTDGTIHITNGAVTNIISPNGNILFDNGDAQFEINPAGEISGTNSSGSFALKSSGEMDINGCTVTTSGNVITSIGTNLDEFKALYDAHQHTEQGNGQPTSPPILLGA